MTKFSETELEQIELFVRQKLSDADRAAVGRRRAIDKAFDAKIREEEWTQRAVQVAAQLKGHDYIKANAAQWRHLSYKRTLRRRRNTWMAIIGVILIGAATFGISQMNRQSKANQVYNNNTSKEKLIEGIVNESLETMPLGSGLSSIKDNPSESKQQLDSANAAYNAQNFAEAVRLFEAAHADDDLNQERYACSLMKLSRTYDALPILNALFNKQKGDAKKLEIEWFIAVALINERAFDKAREHLNNIVQKADSNIDKKRAQDLLNKLEQNKL